MTVGTKEAAEKLGVTVSMVNRLIRVGYRDESGGRIKLPAYKEGRHYVIADDDLTRFSQKKRPGPGRPRTRPTEPGATV